MPLAIPQICPADRAFSSVDICHNQIEPDPELMPERNLGPGWTPTACRNEKSPGPRPGALISSLVARSVLRDDRAAELVVQADGDQVDVLLDVVGAGGHPGNREDAGEAVVVGAHEQMVVFDGGRPVRSEAVFEADANRATPTGVGRTIEHG